MTPLELLQFIPEEKLEFLAAESKVDVQVKKLTGRVVFQLILFSMLDSSKTSLRVMENIFHSSKFKMMSGLEEETTKYNSIRDRIVTMKPEFFKQIFAFVFEKFNKHFGEESSIIRYDSTLIAASSKLVDWGMKSGQGDQKVHLKYTMGMKGSFPCQVTVYNKPKEICEDYTIPPTILSESVSKTGIIVFDRGVQSRKNFRSLTANERRFITRTKSSIRYRTIRKLRKGLMPKGSTVNVKEDLIVQLKDANEKWDEMEFRLIRGILKETGEPICFLTNIIDDLNAYEIADIYRRRWDIELLFKFLKQHLNLNHLITRKENGIQVMIYMTLILAILIIAYKKLNKISSNKIAKHKFTLELEKAIIKQIVICCEGDPDKLGFLFKGT